MQPALVREVEVAAAAAPGAAVRRRLSFVRALAVTSRPSITAMVLVTMAAGMVLADGAVHLWPALHALLSTALLVSCSSGLNGYLERHSDARMFRTRRRPLPSGAIRPAAVLWLSLAGTVVSLGWLWATTNALTAALGALSFLLYVCVYTPLKKRTSAAMHIGAIPGALPPLMGVAAIDGRLTAIGFSLFALLFLWQLPHFLSISLMYQEDYARAGLKVHPVVHGVRSTRMAIRASSALLVAASLVPVLLGAVGLGYALAALGIGIVSALIAFRPVKEPRRWAREVLLGTVIQLPALVAALVGASI